MRPQGTPSDWLQWLIGEDADRRQDARMALGSIESGDAVVPDRFIDALGDSNDDVVFWSLVALERLEERSGPARSQIIELARSHPQFGIRQAAVKALPRIAPADATVQATLVAALTDTSPFVRREALQALASVPNLADQHILAIAAAAHDPDATVARWSEIALRNIRLRTGQDA